MHTVRIVEFCSSFLNSVIFYQKNKPFHCIYKMYLSQNSLLKFSKMLNFVFKNLFISKKKYFVRPKLQHKMDNFVSNWMINLNLERKKNLRMKFQETSSLIYTLDCKRYLSEIFTNLSQRIFHLRPPVMRGDAFWFFDLTTSSLSRSLGVNYKIGWYPFPIVNPAPIRL